MGRPTYDSATEHRGLPTSVDVGLATGPDVFTYAYNPAGAPTTVSYPNGTTASYGYDQLEVPTTLEYANGGDPFLAFASTVDVEGRVLGYTSNASAQAYTYDKLGRLTKTEDDRDGGCTTRTYGFNDTSERTSYASYAPAGDGTCQAQHPGTIEDQLVRHREPDHQHRLHLRQPRPHPHHPRGRHRPRRHRNPHRDLLLNRPGMSGESFRWKDDSHGTSLEVPVGAA